MEPKTDASADRDLSHIPAEFCTASNPKAEAIDAGNRLYWRANVRRLEAEVVRDAVLAVSGDLNPHMGGPGYRDFRIKATSMDDHFLSTGVDTTRTKRRTIYRTWARSANNSLLDALDCPDPSVTTPRRTVTTTPVQALAILNSQFSVSAAERFAARLRSEGDESISGRVKRAFQLALARLPSRHELALAVQFVEGFGLARFCLMMFNTNEFVYVD